jgi:hypothetical protein
MAMLEAQEKGLYYPTPLAMVKACYHHIRFETIPEKGIIFDPCCGKGEALRLFQDLLGTHWQSYGIEIDDSRYDAAAKLLRKSDEVHHCALQDTILFGDVDILFLNPPYDGDQERHERMEHQFLRWTGHLPRENGLLFWIVPERMMVDSWGKTTRSLLRQHRFTNPVVLRFPEPEYDAFHQVVLIARKAKENEFVYIGELEPKEDCLGDIPFDRTSHRAQEITFSLGYKNPVNAEKFLIELKPRLERRPPLYELNWRALRRALPDPNQQIGGRFTPLYPLKQTMAVLVACSGMLNNTRIGDLLIRGGSRIGKGEVDRQEHAGGGDSWKVRTVPVTVFQVLNLRTKEFSQIDEMENPEQYQQFIKDHAATIVQVAAEQYPALYDPAKDRIDFDRWLRAPRILAQRGEVQGAMPQQADRMSALVKGFRHGYRSLELIGTPGTGKTIMSIGVMHQLKLDRGELGKNHKTVVLVPSSPLDLADKWCNEIETCLSKFNESENGDDAKLSTDPLVWTTIINDVSEARAAFERPGWGWLLIRETKSKQANPWLQIKLPEQGKPRQRKIICPRCLRKLTDAELEKYLENLDEQNKAEAEGKNPHSAQKRTMLSCQDQFDEDGKQIAIGCREAWWTRIVPEGTERRQHPVAKYIKDYHRRQYDLIKDEDHEYKGVTGRGGAAYDLTIGARKSLGLTGTYFNGKASGIFYLMYRNSPHFRDLFTADGKQLFIDLYGCEETFMYEKPKVDTHHTVTGFEVEKGETREAPGLKPQLVGLTLPQMVILSKADLDIDMVPYSEHTFFVNTTDEHHDAYSRFKDQIEASIKEQYIAAMQGTEGAMRKAISYRSWGFWALHSCLDNPLKGLSHEAGIYIPPKVRADFVFPKEEALIRLIWKNKMEGRGVLCYLQQMAQRDISPRLMGLCHRFGLRATVMHQTVKERVKFIDSKIDNGFDVAFTNHQLVKVGVDIVSTPEVLWYSLYRSINTLDVPQANQRPHRPHQLEPVRVVYMGCQDTVQSRDAGYVAEKVKVMQIFQGDAPNGLAMLETVSTFQDLLQREISEQSGDYWFESELKLTDLPPIPSVTFGLPTNGSSPKCLSDVNFASVEKGTINGEVIKQKAFF